MWLKKLFAKSPSVLRPDEPPPDPVADASAIAEAKRNPNSWVYAIDGIADSNGVVPPERIRGAWKVNAEGEIEGKFIPNPSYRPLGGATPRV